MPKLRLLLEIVAEEEMDAALLQSMAVWQPKEVLEMKREIRSSASQGETEPPSLERIMGRFK